MTRYSVKDGAVIASYHENGKLVQRPVTSALTANGGDLEAFERALDQLRRVHEPSK